MFFRQMSKIFRGKAKYFIYGVGFVYENNSSEKPTDEQKIQMDELNKSKLTYDQMIKQSTIDAVNSASQALTVTYTAIETTSKEYRLLLNKLISLIEETKTIAATDAQWDMIVEIRSEVDKKKAMLTRLISFMDYVQKMASAATEISFLSGMDNLSISLSERIENALRNVKREINSNEEVERAYRYTQQQSIINTDNEKLLIEINGIKNTEENN
ncbi:uncharacterized protein [Prorops nasuta]|uniref:uncharacterized protein n=1 Tax=Prorops nasuta TaxID=863751 RepID=UPI0034CFB8AA